MSFFNNTKMKPKLIGTFLLAGIIPLVIIAWFSTDKSQKEMLNISFSQLEAVQMIKKGQVESFFSERIGDVKVLSDNMTTKLAMAEIKKAKDEAKMNGYSGADVTNDLGYTEVHDVYHPSFAYYMETYGYYDIFLIGPDNGDIFYTVTKESDFMTTLSRETTHLAELWKKVMQSGQAELSDMEPYAPSNGAPAMFVGSPVRDGGDIIGVLAFQISNEAINGIMQERSGMGETGETYLVGFDKRMRSDSFLDPKGHSVLASFAGTIEKNGVDTRAVNESIAGRKGREVITDYNGNPVLSVYESFDIGSGVKWIAIAEIDEAEVLQPITALRNSIIIIGLVVAALIAVLAFFMAVSIANPIQKITEIAKFVALGDTTRDVNIQQGDEVGELADSFKELIESQKGKAAVAESIANGNLNTDVPIASDADDLGKAVLTVKETFQSIVDEMNRMSDEHNKGDIDVVIPSEKFKGAYQVMTQGVNDMVAGHIAVKKKAMACVAEFGKGNFEAELEKFPGKKAFINEIIETVRENLKAVIGDVDSLATAAVDGQLSSRADAEKHEGDFRTIVEGVNGTLDAVIKPVQEAAGILEQMSKGNLTESVSGDYKGDHAVIKDSLNSTLESLNDILSQVNVSVEQVSSGAQQVSSSSQSLSQGATEQASSLEETSASINEITSQTKQNAENASQANQLASEARSAADKGNEQMKTMLDAMSGINDSSDQISKIIKVIDEIAFQTNLLALNAAVEAARAGVHGKGFAVVAEEVRNLAQRSAKAAKETTELIEDSVSKVENGTKIANDTAQALEGIVSGVAKATDLVGDIASASNEQAQGLEQVTNALGQIDQVTQSNTANAEESASAAEELSSQSVYLKQMVAKFRIKETAHAEMLAATNKIGENGGHEQQLVQPAAAPSEILNLDDDDFGKF